MDATSTSSSIVETVSLEELRTLGLLRDDADVSMDRASPSTYGHVSDHGQNLAPATFESRVVLQQRCREFARRQGFSLRVANNRWRKTTREGNAKYICKPLKGQQPLVPGNKAAWPFFFTVYGLRDEWKVTQMCLAHNHYRHAEFQGETFVEGNLRGDTTPQRQRDVPYSVMREILEREMLPAYSETWANVTGRAITDFLMSRQIITNRQTASRLKLDLLESLRDDVLASYQKLEAYLRMSTDANATTSYGFEKQGDGVFSRACFFPGACLKAMQHFKHVIGVDGTHLKGDMNKRGIFLLATTKDLNDHILVVGLDLVSQEDYANWKWFLSHMKMAIIAVDAPWKPVFVSDRQKGLLAAVSEEYPDSGHRFCVRHIISNIAKRGSSLTPAEQGLVFQMARSECENDYKFYSSNLADTRSQAVEYLNGIAKEHWVTYAFNEAYNQPSSDEVTSNLSEAANHWLGNPCRSSYPLEAFEQYMIKLVEKFAAHRREASKVRRHRQEGAEVPGNGDESVISTLAPFYNDKLTAMMALTKRLHILPCLDGQYMVRFTDISSRPDHAHMWRTVNLVERGCTCRRWQDENFPCVHAVKAAIHHGIHVTQLLDVEMFSTATAVKCNRVTCTSGYSHL